MLLITTKCLLKFSKNVKKKAKNISILYFSNFEQTSIQMSDKSLKRNRKLCNLFLLNDLSFICMYAECWCF